MSKKAQKATASGAATRKVKNSAKTGRVTRSDAKRAVKTVTDRRKATA